MTAVSAIHALVKGKKVRRSVWDKNVFVFLEKGSAAPDEDFNRWNGIDHIGAVDIALFDKGDFGTVVRNPTIKKHLADGSIESGAAFSALDLLSNDWEIVA